MSDDLTRSRSAVSDLSYMVSVGRDILMILSAAVATYAKWKRGSKRWMLVERRFCSSLTRYKDDE